MKKLNDGPGHTSTDFYSRRAWGGWISAASEDFLRDRALDSYNNNYYHTFRLKCALELVRRGVITKDQIRAWFVAKRMGLHEEV